MEKILTTKDDLDLNNALIKFNESIFEEYEGMLYFLELIINNFESLKLIENTILQYHWAGRSTRGRP